MSFILKRRKLVEDSILGIVFRAQCTGTGCTRYSQVPSEILDDASDRLDQDGIPETIQELDDFSVDVNYDAIRCLDTVRDVYCRLTNFEARRSHENRDSEDDQAVYASKLIQYGGIDVLVRLLMYDSLIHPECFVRYTESDEHLRVKSVVLEILCKLIATKHGEKLAKELTERSETLDYIFSLLAYDKTCITACQFLEDLLQARKQVLKLGDVANLRALVSGLDDYKLANFCRVLAVTISDLDIYENKSSLYAQNVQKRSTGFVNARDVNQELLLTIPELITRLINIAVSKAYYPRYRGMNSELDNWMEWIENAMSDDVAEPVKVDDLLNFIGGISEPSTPGGYMVQQPGLKISMDLIMRVQVIYVLGLFLVGKHRKKVQRKLSEMNLVPGLSELFDQFIWKCQSSPNCSHRNSNNRHRLRGHNASCECSPEVALKIQFLRLVHSFCDHSDYKHLLLSRSELNELKRINSKAGVLKVEGLDNVNKSMMCRGSKGLLTKIVEVMKKEPTASTFRFWLARAVESYLRGSTSYCDQIFLLRKGLLQHIASNIVEHDIRPKEILQSSFDLLGELVKFNEEAFKAFDQVLCSKDKLDKFVVVVNKNLVDSNMFIRALVLSLEHFMKSETSEYRDLSNKDSFLLEYVASFEKQMDYLRRLINLINVQSLTQENVSCLNTTLVFLMFANQKDQLPRYLQALMKKGTGSGECVNNHVILKNFRELLVFWQDHYLHKDKDCSALEKSSRISFDYWKETVNTLISDDREPESSILHYVEPDYETQRDS